MAGMLREKKKYNFTDKFGYIITKIIRLYTMYAVQLKKSQIQLNKMVSYSNP